MSASSTSVAQSDMDLGRRNGRVKGGVFCGHGADWNVGLNGLRSGREAN